MSEQNVVTSAPTAYGHGGAIEGSGHGAATQYAPNIGGEIAISRRVRTHLARALMAVIVAAPVALTGAANASPGNRPVAAAATHCGFGGLEQEHLGPTYVTSLSVTRVSCATGKKVVKAYYRCRVRSGGVRGRCHKTVLGYHCSETRAGISVQFDARVTCTSGHRRVVHTYAQDT